MVKPTKEIYIYLPIVQDGVHKPFKFIFIKEMYINDSNDVPQKHITFRYIKKNAWNAYSIMTYKEKDVFFNEKDCWVECNRMNLAKREKYMRIASTYLAKASKYGDAVLEGKYGSHK